ncbi:uncharacterized protein ACIQIH_012730 isoform 1-T1 [Cyanocitta cristata]
MVTTELTSDMKMNKLVISGHAFRLRIPEKWIVEKLEVWGTWFWRNAVIYQRLTWKSLAEQYSQLHGIAGWGRGVYSLLFQITHGLSGPVGNGRQSTVMQTVEKN